MLEQKYKQQPRKINYDCNNYHVKRKLIGKVLYFQVKMNNTHRNGRTDNSNIRNNYSNSTTRNYF